MGVCFVPNCSSGSRGDKNCHRLRPSKKTGRAWTEMLKKIRADTMFDPSNRNHWVCHLHFRESELVKTDSFLIKDEIVQLPRDRWKLADTAIPSQFPMIPKYLQPQQTAARRPLIRVKCDVPIKKQKVSLEEHSNQNAETDVVSELVVSSNVTLKQWWADNQIQYPAWKLHEITGITSLVHIVYEDDCPVILKSIVECAGESRNLGLKYFVRGMEVTAKLCLLLPNPTESAQRLEKFSTIGICPGVSGFDSICSFRHGRKTAKNWRSTSCWEFGDFVVCEPCKELHYKLAKKKTKTGQRCVIVKSNKINMNRSRFYYKRQAKVLSKTQLKLRRELLNVKNLLCRVSVEDLELKMKTLPIPLPMKSNVMHSLKIAKSKSLKGMRYASEWLLESLLLRIKSPAAYRHLREAKILPLPHPSTLTKLISAQKCRFGFNEVAMEAIGKLFLNKPRRDRQGVLCFDEVKLRETLEFNSTTNQFVGYIDYGECSGELINSSNIGKLANHALVIMYRPFNDHWVQPIAAFATREAASGTALQKVIMEAVIRLEAVGAEVVSLICDGSKPNRSFWKMCGIGENEGSVINKIQHPCDDKRQLFFTSDVPHLFKCIRNHCRKYEFVDYLGEEINFGFYEKLFLEDSKRINGIRKCPKLTKSHIWPNNFEKMVVPLATQLFSRSVSTGLSFYREMNAPEFIGSEVTEKFTLELNEVFDALNARFPSQGITLDSEGYHTLRNFLAKLNSYSFTHGKRDLNNIYFASSETLLGLKVTITSTLEIINYLIHQFGYEYVLTGKNNQDCLERFFGLIRAAGGREEHPTVSNFVQLFRLLSLYNPIKRILRGNIGSDETVEVLVSFENQLRDSVKQKQTDKEKQRRDLEDLIVEKLLEREMEGEELVYENCEIGSLDLNILYNLAGFLCFKAKKFIKCQDCLNTLVSVGIDKKINPQHAILTNIMDYGPLHHPTQPFYEAVIAIEKSLCEVMQCQGPGCDIVYQCIKITAFSSQLIGCKLLGHYKNVMLAIFPYYITMRLHFLTKSKRNDLGHGKATKNKRKESKLKS